MKVRITELKKIDNEWYQKITDFKDWDAFCDFFRSRPLTWSRFEVTIYNDVPEKPFFAK